MWLFCWKMLTISFPYGLVNMWLPDVLKNFVRFFFKSRFFQSSVKTNLHKISRCETLIISMMKLALRRVWAPLKIVKKQRKIHFFSQFFKTIFLASRKFSKPQLILLKTPVNIAETCCIKIQSHFQIYFWCFWLKNRYTNFFYPKKRYSVALEHQ